MRTYNFYVSGIFYGRLRMGEGQTLLSRRDVFSGNSEEWKSLTEKENGFYKSFMKMDFLAIAEKADLYEKHLKGMGKRGK